MKLVHWLFSIALFTASCDLILTFQVFGTVRLGQFIMLAITLAAVAHIARTHTVLLPRGGVALVLWWVLQGLLLSRSSIPLLSFELYVLLTLMLIGPFAIVQLYGRSSMVEPLMRVYLLSFVFVAGFGLFQFVAPVLHLGQPLIVQWIVHGIIPRINGFTYEASYFATYLVLGFIMLIDLRVSGARIAAGRRWKWFTIIVVLAFFLCTSKTAMIVMVLEGTVRLIQFTYRRVRKQAGRLAAGSLVFPLPRLKVLVGIVLAVAAAVGLYAGVSRIVDPTVFLAGSGLANTPAHSLNGRTDRYVDTLHVFEEHPWIGLGLGGATGRVAQLNGIQIHNMVDLRPMWAFPVPLEILAGSGIFGFIPFLWFFLAITVGETRLIRTHWDDDRAKWMRAMIRAMAYQWICLLADQNVMRIYLWFHVTMLMVVGYNLRFVKQRNSPPEAPAFA